MNNIYILAQAGDEGPSSIGTTPINEQSESITVVADSNPAPVQQGKKPSSTFQPLILFGVMLIVMYFLLFRGPQKKQKQHKQMVNNLKKNDKVRTIGGIIGTIVDIKGDEVTLKVDESNNTKIKVASSAIGKNVSKEGN
ncbi:MAG: preprotein translocase subunit YajC [Planctomycetota bacterium]|jgi:preprotein translocase subunit YajC